MRKIVRIATLLATATAAVLIGSPAHAATGGVLTVGSLGGTNANVNDVATSSLKSGTQATFTTTSGGSTGVFCSVSTLSAKILTNPAAGGVATESLTVQTFSSCTSNIGGVNRVNSITVNGLPYNASVNGTTKAITVSPVSGNLNATVSLATIIGTVNCTYSVTGGGSFNGTTSNTDNSISFANQGLSRTAGPAFVCPGSSFFSATYAPVVDSTAGGANLFVQ